MGQFMAVLWVVQYYIKVLRNNANVRQCSYFELGIPVPFSAFLWYELKRMSFSKFVRNSIGVNKLNKVVV